MEMTTLCFYMYCKCLLELYPINVVFQYTHVVEDVKCVNGQRNNSHGLIVFPRNKLRVQYVKGWYMDFCNCRLIAFLQ